MAVEPCREGSDYSRRRLLATQDQGGERAEGRLTREAGMYAIDASRLSFGEVEEAGDVLLESFVPASQDASAEALTRALPIVTAPGIFEARPTFCH